MKAAPLRFLKAVFWPLTIWTSLTHFEEHAADDYVERTFPIAATAVAFWLSLAVLVWLTLNASTAGVVSSEAGDVAIRISSRNDALGGVLQVFTPVIYIAGLWLFTAREERFSR